MARISAARLAFRVACVLALVAAITFACFRLVPVNATTVGFVYLVAVLFLATNRGLLEATLGSIASVLCFNFFFFPPIGTFTVADPQNWVALAAFLVTAITASQLSAQARKRALEAQRGRSEIEKLYALSRSILLIEPAKSVPAQLAHCLSENLGASAAAVYVRETGEVHRSGSHALDGLDDQLRDAAVDPAGAQDAAAGRRITAIRLGEEPIGSVGVSGVALSDSALQSLANLVAIGLERARAQEAAGRAEAARQSDELKSTLLDAIAHEFKTPLTTIKAATTSLLSGNPPKPEGQRGFITIVDEEADRLSALVTDAIRMARIESGRTRLHRRSCSVGEIAGGAIEKFQPAARDRDIELTVPPGVPNVLADGELIELAFRQLLDNAIKFSPGGSPVFVAAEWSGERVIVSVADRGSGIPESEQQRIFEKFYRARDANPHIPGAGLGLALAREIVRAHGGEIWVESVPGAGSTFRFSLPLAPATEPQ